MNLRWVAMILGFMILSPYGIAEEQQKSEVPKEEAPVAAAGAKPDQAQMADAVKTAEEIKIPEPAVGVAQGAWDTCLPNRAVVDDLKKLKSSLEDKEKELKAKDTELRSREAALNDELKRLDQLRKDVANLKAQKKQKNDEQVAKLVEALESMSPKPAAGLLSKLDEDLAVSAMGAISTQKLAKILAAMDLTRSARLSELLTLGENAPQRDLAQSKGGQDANAHQ